MHRPAASPLPGLASADETLTGLAWGVTFPEPFEAAGVHCGIKHKRPDLAVIHSPVDCSAAAVLTRNRVKAAPLRVTQEHLLAAPGRIRAIVVNSGNANACTGPRGMADARAMAEVCAGELGVDPEQVLVASTGVIGVPLPMERVRAGIQQACQRLSRAGGPDAAIAIMTTDRRPKALAFTLGLGDGRVVRVGGMAKGSGMIHPDMATMLAFLTTDAPVEPRHLQRLLREVTERTFNMITVDGDTSTNDMAILLASGQVGGEPLAPGTEDFARLQAGIERLASYLAKEIARDGEGATRLVEVRVTGARTQAEARTCARAIAGSNLVKTAIHGADPNWGRIAAAAGYSGVEMDPDGFSVWLGDVPVAAGGQEVPFDQVAARSALTAPEVRLTIDLGTGGRHEAIAWTCDMSEEYVRINASYRS
ncbi:MAG: bifunctional glutamate N-acetyltransferase/amino-acid acetyltransferase ArgJ [Firmicutes bacterium]|nr:bifunctional glutamate N-acetyltransferase/amino-acid acetyltransferase ArgJ [Bacillota bacterium]